MRREQREQCLPPRRQREGTTGFELAQARHAAQRLLRAGDKLGARQQLARCSELLHLAHPRAPWWSWPGEYAAMRPLRTMWW